MFYLRPPELLPERPLELEELPLEDPPLLLEELPELLPERPLELVPDEELLLLPELMLPLLLLLLWLPPELMLLELLVGRGRTVADPALPPLEGVSGSLGLYPGTWFSG